MANSLLLLSQIQAKSAVACQRVVKLRPKSIASLLQPTTGTNDRLRATVRGALDNRPEADISESTFLGRAGSSNNPSEEKHDDSSAAPTIPRVNASSAVPEHNPVDEMMALERELRDMDMTLELGNSIASLEARNQNRAKNLDGSFMVVAPGANSYMSSSSMWTPTTATPARSNVVVRARANRVQTMLEASTPRPHPMTTSTHIRQQQPHQQQHPPHSLESSWWDGANGASQVLTSSVASLASSVAHDMSHGAGHNNAHQQHPANTKQLMRLMDSLKTLGDENAALLRQVEQAEAARMEAKMAQTEMRRFREDYSMKFKALREALKKFREDYPAGNELNPVTSSEFVQTASTSDKLQRQEQLIRKLTADLKKEKEESKKKDAALRKYENFYREVKARSAQKAAQRQKELNNLNRKVPGR
jgi:hypothetical protein